MDESASLKIGVVGLIGNISMKITKINQNYMSKEKIEGLPNDGKIKTTYYEENQQRLDEIHGHPVTIIGHVTVLLINNAFTCIPTKFLMTKENVDSLISVSVVHELLSIM